MIPVSYWLILSFLLFSIGAYGVLSRKNAIVVLMSIEIMLNAANINFVMFSSYYSVLHPTAPAAQEALGQVFTLFSIAIAAAEVAVGLAIFLVVYRRYKTIDVDKINILRW